MLGPTGDTKVNEYDIGSAFKALSNACYTGLKDEGRKFKDFTEEMLCVFFPFKI